MRQLKILKQITQRDDESVSRYFQEISRYPTISAEEEVELCIRMKNGDHEALERLVVSNLRFVVSVAKQYQNQGLPFSDLINEGNVGLVKAAKKYDETRGFKFISYAVWWIRQAIMQAISENSRMVHLPLNRISAINKISKAIIYLEQIYEREPSEAEIAEYLDLNSDDVLLANRIKRRQISFDMPIMTAQNEDFSLYDIVQTGDIPQPDNKMMQESLATNVLRAIEKLEKREADIITMSFGLGNSPIYSLQEIAKKMETSGERIRQLKRIALFKLKKLIRDNPSFLTSV